MSVPTKPKVRAGNLWNTYIRAWAHGAAVKPLDPKFTGHSNAEIVAAYTEGYKSGREAHNQMAQDAAVRYGYEPSILRLAEVCEGRKSRSPDGASAMKIIFLDIDGVLNSERLVQDIDAQHRALGEHECFCYSLRKNMDRRCVARLNRLVREAGAKVVISSSWRLLLDPGEVTGVLVTFGFDGEVIGETPDLVNDPAWLAANRWGRDNHERIERGNEIWEWLVRNPAVTHFVILDDCSDMAHLKPFHVHVDFEVGLEDPDVERAIHLMAKSEGAVAELAVKAFREDAT